MYLFFLNFVFPIFIILNCNGKDFYFDIKFRVNFSRFILELSSNTNLLKHQNYICFIRLQFEKFSLYKVYYCTVLYCLMMIITTNDINNNDYNK